VAFNFEPAVSAIETLPDWSATVALARHSLPSGSTMLPLRHGRLGGRPLLPLREHLPRGSWMTSRCRDNRTHHERAAIPRGLAWRQPNDPQYG
jgi:hypothetical protein